MSNCKQGDLAIIVKALHPLLQDTIGKIVVCKTPAFPPDFPNQLCWLFETPITVFKNTAVLTGAPDSCLKPLRDNDKPDETLTWKPTPNKETV